jgi:4-diphosphocytidyl-2-C-methyl-D-erythritol kinase
MKVTLTAPAKINLTLTVGERLKNGYHDINTIMQAVSLADIVTLENTGQSGITVSLSGKFSEGVPTDDRNICVKAAKLYLQDGLHIHIEKNIPHGAGLGGGSSDAAAVLIGINQLAMLLHAKQKGLSDEETYKMTEFISSHPDTEKLLKALELAACSLGADVPFFIRGGLRLCTGIGMDLSPADYDWGVPDPRIVIAMGNERISTARAYEILDRSGAQTFDECITNSEIVNIKRLMSDAGAAKISLSGSGAAVYAVFPGTEVKNINLLKKNLRNDGYFSETCEPVAYGGKVTWAQI